MVSQNHPLSYLAHILTSNLVGANTTTNPGFYIPTVQQLQGVAALTNCVPGEGVSLSCQVYIYLYYGTYLLHMNLCHSHDDELAQGANWATQMGPSPSSALGSLGQAQRSEVQVSRCTCSSQKCGSESLIPMFDGIQCFVGNI